MKKIYSFAIMTDKKENDLIFLFDDQDEYFKGLENIKQFCPNPITHEAEIEDDEYDLIKDKISNKIYDLENI